MLFQYDDNNEDSILKYAEKLKGKSFRDILDDFDKSVIKNYGEAYEVSTVNEHSAEYLNEKDDDFNINVNSRGGLGVILERCYFGYKPNSEQKPDFPKVGIELKQTCLNKKKNGNYSAGERLSITNISYKEPVEEEFKQSHVWDKIKKILLIHYYRDKEKKNRLDYIIKFVNIFTPSIEDLKIIEDDYHKIINKIKEGKAHELSESDTYYLGACTKGATAASSEVPQFYGEHIKAKKRNFCFKRSYMDLILQKDVLHKESNIEKILKNEQLDNLTFEEYILNKINSYIHKTDKELCDIFDRPYNNNKAQWIDLAYRMLGIRNNHAEEFMKANIVVKTIRIDEDGDIKENMSFPPFTFKNLVNQSWETSEIFEYFYETRFLFVIYKSNGSSYVLQGAQIWNMPYHELNSTVFEEWFAIKKHIENGVKFKLHGTRMFNDLPKESETKILHIRPHSTSAAYKLKNGYVNGNIERDADELPNGEWMTKQSFWINKKYLKSILKLTN